MWSLSGPAWRQGCHSWGERGVFHLNREKDTPPLRLEKHLNRAPNKDNLLTRKLFKVLVHAPTPLLGLPSQFSLLL